VKILISNSSTAISFYYFQGGKAPRMFVVVGYSALFTYLVGWHTFAVGCGDDDVDGSPSLSVAPPMQLLLCPSLCVCCLLNVTGNDTGIYIDCGYTRSK